MPKINQEEYEILQFLNNTKDWIVRNPDGQLWAVGGEAPRKSSFYETWKEGDGQDVSKVDVSSFLFQFIQWEDENPYSIDELIKEYECSTEHVSHVVNERVKALGKAWSESEETEVKKDIEWLKSAIQQNLDFYNDNDEEWQMAKVRAYAKSLDLIDQLDEPEVLSQEWINSKTFVVTDSDGDDYAVVAHSDLQNLLVPKQEDADQAYKDGYEKGKQHATEKQSEETETVASVLVDYLIASAKLKMALGMEVEELEE